MALWRSSQKTVSSPASKPHQRLLGVGLLSMLVGGALWGRQETPQANKDFPPAPAASASTALRPAANSLPQRLVHKAPMFRDFDGSIGHCDVLVVGGTPAGVAAALAAARRGASVVLIEERAHLGGDIVYQMMNIWDVPLRPGSSSPVVQGIFAEFFDQLGVAFDIDKAMHLFEESVALEPMLNCFTETRVKRILKEGNRVTGAVLRGGSEQDFTLTARAIVDATNDATFAARAGAGFFLGRQKTNPDKAMQSAGLLFSVSGVDWEEARRYVKGTRLRELTPSENRRVKFSIDLKPVSTEKGPRIKERLGGIVGGYMWERGNIVKPYQPQGPNVAMLSINFGRQSDGTVVLNTLNMLDVNGLSQSSVDAATREALKEIPHFMTYLREAMPGFEHAQLAEIAPELYIRETRHIQGWHILTSQEIEQETRFPDRIALASYPLDLHPYKKGEENPLAPRRYNYTVPLRSLIPTRIDGVFIASRSLSATSAAAGSARVLPITMACGEAAGAAAWLCTQRRVTPHKLAVDTNLTSLLQDTLRDWGADIGDRYPPRLHNSPPVASIATAN